MDIQDFFQLCSGKWVSQRTTQHLIEQQNQSERSDLWVDLLDATHPEVIDLCQLQNFDASLAYCGLSTRWSEVAEAYQSRLKPRNEGAALLVPIMNQEHPTRGTILRKLNADTTVGTFVFGADEVLTIVLEINGFVNEERIWFASSKPSNLRLRSSILKKGDTVYTTVFRSEIRMLPPSTPVEPEATATQSNS
jgi:phycoerythrin-associated linker protein